MRELRQVFLDGIPPRDTEELDVRTVIRVQASAAGRVPAHGVRPHDEAFEELPRGGHVDFGEVTLNRRGGKVSFEPRDVDREWLEGADEQRVALEAVQPHGGVRIDVLKRARDHLETGVVDLVVRQPLDEDASRPEGAPALRVELARVEVAIAGVLGIERVDRHHVVRLGGDEQVIAPVVDGDAHARITEDAVIDLGKEARRADHARNELDDVESLERHVATERPHRAAGAEADHQHASGRRVQEHRQVCEHLLDLGIVVHEGHVRIRAAGARDRPAIDAEQLAIVDIGGDFHDAGDVFLVVQDLLLRLARDIGEAERRCRDDHRDDRAQRARIHDALAETRRRRGRQEDTADSHAEQDRDHEGAMDAQHGNGDESGHPRAHDGAERVARVGRADAAAHHMGTARDDLAHERKRRAHAQGGGQDHDERLEKREPERSAPVGVAEALPPPVETIEQAADFLAVSRRSAYL